MKTLSKRKADENSKYWQRKAMAQWGRIIHAKGFCAVCASLNENHGGKLEAHHIVTRSARSCRFDPKNGIILCSFHHKYSTELSAHKAPLAFFMWLEKHDPDKYDYAKGNSIYRPGNDSKTTAKQWCEILEALK